MGTSLLEYYGNLASAIHADAFKGIRTLEDWNRARPTIHRQYLHSLGLEKLPDSRDPHVRDYGVLRGPGYTARKIGFQIVPDCYGSGIVFYPDPLPGGRNPAVLYLCGHSNFGVVGYHPHAIMWARRGYVCLIIDAIRQTDNTGEHSGLHRHRREDWISMGYTAAGGELLNSWGALNTLASLPEVDPARIGATGLSGGGAHCFFLGLADERVAAVASTCGVVNLAYTLKNRNYNENCDCMFWYNLYQRDTGEYGALMAPRPLLFAHANGDYLFTPGENRDLHATISRVYQLYGSPGKCSLFQFDGPHSYQPASVATINDWFDRHLAGRPMGTASLAGPELGEKQCTIFNGDFPLPDRLDILPEILTPPKSFPIPDSLEELAALRKRVIGDLEGRVLNYVTTSTEHLELQRIHEWHLDPVRPFPVMRKYRGSIGGMELWVTHHQPAPDSRDLLVYLRGEYADDERVFANLPHNARSLDIMTIEPRAGGLNSYGESARVSLLRAGLHLGVTPVSLWIKDLRDVLAHFRAEGALEGRDVYLYGARDAGTAALYTAVLDESIHGVILEDIYGSHRDGGHIPGILKVMDVEQALGLLAPRVIGLDTFEWEFGFWSSRLYDRLGILDRFVHTHSMAHTLERIFGRK